MPQPFNYTVQQPQVSSYFDAFRQGRADRMAGEEEARSKSLAQYLPGALQGDAQAKQQALASASPDQQIALSGHFAQMDAQTLAKTKENQSRVASLAAWADTPEKWTIANAEAKKIFPGSPDIPFEQRGAVIAKAQTVSEQLDQAWKQKGFDLEREKFGEQRRSNMATEEIQRAGVANRAPSQRPLPAGMQTAEDNDIKIIQGAAGINTRLGHYADLIDKGELSLGPGSNFLSGVQNFTGTSSRGSQNYALFQSDLENLRNESLRLNAGPQTDSDAQRAWNELITNINDPQVVKRQIKRIQDLNTQASGFKQQAIAIRRARNGADAFDFQSLGVPQAGAPVTAPPPPPSGQTGPKSTPIIKTQAEFDALPSGAMYVEPDGKRYRKP